MSIVPAMVAIMVAENNRRMMEQSRRRREEEERRRKKREEEEKRKEEEYRKMVEHRKTSPVVYNSEEWQQNRCLKAIALQPSVQELMNLIEEVRPKIVEKEKQKQDTKILEVGYEYEQVRRKLDSDISTLEGSGIRISGEQYKLTRLSPVNTNLARPKEVTEYIGNIFNINDGQPIEINPTILSSDQYYRSRYMEMKPDEIEIDFNETNQRMKKYQTFGKYLGFLLKTKKYQELERHSKSISKQHEECGLRKKEMDSYSSLTKEQLLVIKSYFEHLNELSIISNRLQKLFYEKTYIDSYNNERIYDLTIKEILSNSENSELVYSVADYINRIRSNDKETLDEAYELVKGQYPINIYKRFIYELIIKNLSTYKKEKSKKLTLGL